MRSFWSGAVGLGRQRLRYRRVGNSSFADLQNPHNDFDGKACGAVGQSSLMALYDTMFSQIVVWRFLKSSNGPAGVLLKLLGQVLHITCYYTCSLVMRKLKSLHMRIVSIANRKD
ncbi:delta-1-pyrroline-5-carboxylate synthase 2 isoform X2 [Quercus suber]|uniref:delta-1-pyrroline-5-carboxylate synthase 2 isoform X2 n=1 Tax=Quercus suber TaxID=58331 RepID=UPI0032DFDE2A